MGPPEHDRRHQHENAIDAEHGRGSNTGSSSRSSTREGAITTDTTDRSRVRATVSLVWRFAVDLVVIAVWVGFLVWLFLATAWPRWAFYALLVLGIVGYTRRTGYASSGRR